MRLIFRTNTNKYHAEALYQVCQQSNKGKLWKMSPFAKHTRGCKHPNIKYNNKLFKITKIIRNICLKANRKLNALATVANYMELLKRRILMNAFFKVQFNYCPVI